MTEKEIQSLVQKNEELREHITALEFEVKRLERSCACYRNSQLVSSEKEKKEN